MSSTSPWTIDGRGDAARASAARHRRVCVSVANLDAGIRRRRCVCADDCARFARREAERHTAVSKKALAARACARRKSDECVPELTATACMGTLRFSVHMKQRSSRRKGGEEKRRSVGENFPRRYYPDRVRGYFSAPQLVEHPCFNSSIETPRTRAWQIASTAAMRYARFRIAYRRTAFAGRRSAPTPEAAVPRPPRRRLGRHAAIDGARENLQHRPLCPAPRPGAPGSALFSRTIVPCTRQTFRQIAPVDGFNHFPHRCLAAARRNAEAARLARAAT